MKYFKKFRAKPRKRIRLKDLDPDFTGHESKESAERECGKLQKRIEDLQFRLYAEGKHSLLICLQALDAGGKDGVVRHVFSAMNPQSCRVANFKQPSAEERGHDFLWRIEREAPRRGEVAIFNRSQYEDVLVVRVHHLVPKKVWSKRYEQINDFERRLTENGTRILKFFLHISKEEQLRRFGDRLEDPSRQWKISDADYQEREYWKKYQSAYEDAINRCSTDEAPWFVIPSNHKWFRDLAISQIIVKTMEDLDMKFPEPTVDIAAVRRKYHRAVTEEKRAEKV